MNGKVLTVEDLTPYTHGCSFGVKSYFLEDFCLKADIIKIAGKPSFVIRQDFFTTEYVIDDTWKIIENDGKIICTKFFNPKLIITPIDPETNITPSVKWDESKGNMNFVNEALWERGIIREINGVTYYPLDLFRFKNRQEVMKSPTMEFVKGLLDLSHKRFTKTLYYYIENGKIYIGVWNYVRRMPCDPVFFGNIKR